MVNNNHGYILTEKKKKSSWNLLKILEFWPLLKQELFTLTTYVSMAN